MPFDRAGCVSPHAEKLPAVLGWMNLIEPRIAPEFDANLNIEEWVSLLAHGHPRFPHRSRRRAPSQFQVVWCQHVFRCWRHVARPAPQPDRFKQAAQVAGGALVQVQVLGAGGPSKRELGLKVLKLHRHDAGAPDDIALRRRSRFLAAQVGDVQCDQVLAAPHPRAAAIDSGEEGRTVRDPAAAGVLPGGGATASGGRTGGEFHCLLLPRCCPAGSRCERVRPTLVHYIHQFRNLNS
jgi:hypothetical protein